MLAQGIRLNIPDSDENCQRTKCPPAILPTFRILFKQTQPIKLRTCLMLDEACEILELLDLTLRDLEIRKAELECAVTKGLAEALLSG